MKLLIQQLCVPDYRIGLYDYIDSKVEMLAVCGGDTYFNSTIKSAANGKDWFIHQRNVFLVGRNLAYQIGTEKLFSQFDVVILEFNPRMINLIPYCILLRALGIPVLVWGHLWGRGGAQSNGCRLRKVLAYMADGVLCYTDSQARFLKQTSYAGVVTAAPNSCVSQAICSISGAEEKRRNVVYVGRLIKDKKVSILLEGFARACRLSIDFSSHLIIVGDGPERAWLEASCEMAGISSRVEFRGHQSDQDTIKGIYEHAFVSVSPGYVGLSIIQGLAFGVPAIVSRDEPHSPEIEVCREFDNTIFFSSDDPDSLAKALLNAWRNWKGIEEKRVLWSRFIAANYTFESMGGSFIEAAATVVRRRNSRFNSEP